MSIKLLVADDSITIQKVIGIIFGGEDYALTVVDNGKSAIEKAREICPDVLLIDALMPGISGYEVVEAVRGTPALANKPILILTGSFEPFDEERAKKCGADDFLAKPFESQHIVNKVKELAKLGASRAHAIPVLPPKVVPVVLDALPAKSAAQPVASQLPETPQAFAPADIWGAFTTEIETPVATASESFRYTEVQSAAPLDFTDELDVFAIVKEESNFQQVHTPLKTGLSPAKTVSQWIPVEEQIFEFEEEIVSDVPAGGLTGSTSPVMDFTFGDIAFEDDEPLQSNTIAGTVSASVAEKAAPVFSSSEPVTASFDEPLSFFTSPIETISEPDQPVLQSSIQELPATELTHLIRDTETIPAPLVLTEEQLKTAISAVSREVIERIVWEIVPDLAEALINEAIRKIKEDR